MSEKVFKPRDCIHCGKPLAYVGDPHNIKLLNSEALKVGPDMDKHSPHMVIVTDTLHTSIPVSVLVAKFRQWFGPEVLAEVTIPEGCDGTSGIKSRRKGAKQ